VISQNFFDAIHIVFKQLENSMEDKRFDRSEKSLWRELSCCVLSSQVPYDLAVEFANKISNDEILIRPCQINVLEQKLFDILSEGVFMSGRKRRYRFPRSKANQLATTKTAVSREWGTLNRLIACMPDATLTRSTLVSLTSGVGPKQASMFLRNVGVSFDLAIIDRHVLNYVKSAGLESGKSFRPGSLISYMRLEEELKAYAGQFGYKVGLLDLAIWIVMKSSRELKIKTGIGTEI
jgi:N-glycosylase/DNA lyase